MIKNNISKDILRVAAFLLIFFSILYALRSKDARDFEYCDTFKRYAVKDVPVLCLEYFI